MTRYRLKMRRAILLFLREEGPSTCEEIGKWVQRSPRTVHNYLRYYRDHFEWVEGTALWRAKK